MRQSFVPVFIIDLFVAVRFLFFFSLQFSITYYRGSSYRVYLFDSLVRNINLREAKVYIFVNSSFTNNKDLSLQIRFIVVIRTKVKEGNNFTIVSNIIYTSLTKYKRVTRAVLISELYAIVASVNILISFSTTINIVTYQLRISNLPTVVYIDLLSLYKYIIKLSTTKEKRFIIDIIAI